MSVVFGKAKDLRKMSKKTPYKLEQPEFLLE